MSKLCSHTLLMNMMLGLVRKHKSYPSILYDKGYDVESICPTLINNRGNEVNPDIILKSHEESNLFIVECKTGTLQKDQSIELMHLTPKEIREQHCTTLEREFSLDKTWTCSEKNLPKVSAKNNEWSLNFPIICKFDSDMIRKGNSVSLNSRVLESLFSSGIRIPPQVPTGYYSFSNDDSNEFILIHILPSIVKLVSLPNGNSTFTLEELLRETHSMYDHLHESEKTKLKHKVGELLRSLDSKDLKEFLKKVAGTPNTWEVMLGGRYLSFRTKCQKLINNYEKSVSHGREVGLTRYFAEDA